MSHAPVDALHRCLVLPGRVRHSRQAVCFVTLHKHGMAERKEEGKSGKVVERTILDDLGCAFEEEGLVWRHLVEDDLDERRRISGEKLW
jgi:hypothetical protein